MSKKRKGARKKQDTLQTALKSYGSKIWSAVTWTPKYLWERFQLNREIYLGLNSLKAIVLHQNRGIRKLYDLDYRIVLTRVPYNEPDLGFKTDERMGRVGSASKRLLNLATPPRWRIRQLEGRAWFDRLVERSQREERLDWGDRLYWWILFNGSDAILAGCWLVYAGIRHHPRNSELASLRRRLRTLVFHQGELIKLLERITTSADGGETPIETRSRELQEQEEEGRRMAEQQDRMRRFILARNELARAFENLENSQSTDSITAGTRLKFSAVRTYVVKALEEANSLIDEDQREDYIIGLKLTTEDVQQGFRFWAGEIAKQQGFFDELIEVFAFIEEQHGEFNPPPQIVKISDLFRKKVADLWGKAQWAELKATVEDIRVMVNQLAEIANSFQSWGKKIAGIQTRVRETEELRSQLKDEYGEEIPPSQEWTSAWETFQKEGLTAFAEADWENLNAAILTIEDPLRKNEYKVRSALERLSTYVNGSSGKKNKDVTRGAGTRHARLRKKTVGRDDGLLKIDLD
ncbi:MAG: hypothetical protein Q8P12_01570 [bacterium]|nr:hypothetical protein [bacterium]